VWAAHPHGLGRAQQRQFAVLAAHPYLGRSAALPILAIAAAMAAVCALPPIPMHGARHRGGLFSIALNALSEISKGSPAG